MRHLTALQWRHNGYDDVSNHQHHDCLLKRLFRHRSKKASKLHVTGLCEGNQPVTVNPPRKGPVTRKIFPFDDVIMGYRGPAHVHCFSRFTPIWEQTIILTAENIICFRNYIRFDTFFIFHMILLDHIDKQVLVSTMRRRRIYTKQFFKSNLILYHICASL